ncbi:MAG: ATP synthase F0 subunit B [Holophagaceae bacterium]|nr:ATP synthase F0 subunit B [Holophagaceae bacterium]
MLKNTRHILFVALAIACVCWLSPPLRCQEPTNTGQVETYEQHHIAGEVSRDSHNGEPHEGGSHHGADVVLFGYHFGATGQFFLKLINFLIFGGLLYWMLKGVLSSAFRARTVEIETKLAQSEKDRSEGEAQLRDLETKMAGLQQELASIMAKAETDADVEKQRILEAAKTEAEQILAQAQSEIDYQKRLAETELRELVARLAVEGAEARIRQQVQGDSVVRVMDQAIQKIGGAN